MKNKIWIIGGSGLVGEAIARSIPLYPHLEFNFLKREQLEISALSQQALPFGKSDIIVDLVGPPPPRSVPNVTPMDYHLKFTTPHNDFMSQTLKNGIGKYIFISSGGSVYGRNETGIPFKEEDLLKPISLYGESKKLQEIHLIKESAAYSAPYIILRPSNVFNSYSNGLKQTGLIGVWMQKFIKKEPLEIYGSTSITKDYISNEDLALSIIESVSKGENEVLNIGSGIGITIQQILDVFEKTYDHIPEKITRSLSPDDVPWMILDARKAKKVLNFEVSTSVLEWISSSKDK